MVLRRVERRLYSLVLSGGREICSACSRPSSHRLHSIAARTVVAPHTVIRGSISFGRGILIKSASSRLQSHIHQKVAPTKVTPAHPCFMVRFEELSSFLIVDGVSTRKQETNRQGYKANGTPRLRTTPLYWRSLSNYPSKVYASLV